MNTNHLTGNAGTEVLVVGAGPTGLVMAAELARRGVRCRIIDTERGPTDKSKAIGIQSRTMEIFENMGLAGEFMRAGLPMNGATIYDEGQEIIHVDFTELPSNYPYLLMIPQAETEKILLANLEDKGIHVERQIRLVSFTQDDKGIRAIISGVDGTEETVFAQWIIGCDGAHSTVRHQLGIPFEGNEYEDGFQLADVRIDWPLPRTEFQLLIHQGWLMAAFPLPGEGNRYRLLLDVPADKAPKDKVPALTELQAVVDERSHVRAVLSDPKWTANYRIHRRIVSTLREGRGFLCGDAAHIHSPAAAQGMNTGIQDVFNLAWKLALVAGGHSPESLLDSYHRERYPVEKGVLTRTDLLLKMVSLRNPLLRRVRDFTAPLLMGFHFVRNKLAKEISELAVEYQDSPVISGYSCQGHLTAGERWPDAVYSACSTGKPVSMYDLLRGGDHVLFLMDGEPESAEADRQFRETLEIAKNLGHGQIKTCLVAKERNSGNLSCNETLIIGDDSGLSTHYTAGKPCVYLVRPDGYVAFCSDADQAAEHLESFLPGIFL